jgi:hypothetical protein
VSNLRSTRRIRAGDRVETEWFKKFNGKGEKDIKHALE